MAPGGPAEVSSWNVSNEEICADTEKGGGNKLKSFLQKLCKQMREDPNRPAEGWARTRQA